jgi:hypothetical protein
MFGRSVRLLSTRPAGSRARFGAVGTALTLALQLGAVLPSVAATTYYVDNTNPTCSNAGTGSEAAPYCSIVSAAAAHHGPDISIRVVAGTYREQVRPYAGAAGAIRIRAPVPAHGEARTILARRPSGSRSPATCGAGPP